MDAETWLRQRSRRDEELLGTMGLGVAMMLMAPPCPPVRRKRINVSVDEYEEVEAE